MERTVDTLSYIAFGIFFLLVIIGCGALLIGLGNEVLNADAIKKARLDRESEVIAKCAAGDGKIEYDNYGKVVKCIVDAKRISQ